jgi:hypothetical protein
MRSRRATRDFPGTIPGGSSVYHLVTISGCHGDEGDREVTRPLVLLRYLSCRRRLSAHEGVRSIGRSIGRSVGRSLGRLAVDVWLLLKLKISIPIRTPGFIEAQFVSLLQDNTHSSRGQ